MELSDLGARPISAEQPAGTDVRGTAEFEALQAEIDRVNDTANPGQTDWNKVVKLASDILATQGKDLLVGSYLAVGLMKQKQVEGFATGLHLLRDMTVQHWDALFPPVKRMRGRRNALQYWLDRIEEVMRDANPQPLEQTDVDAMLACIDELDAFLREKDDEPPGVFRLSSVVKGFPVRVEEVEAPPAAEQTAADAGGDAQVFSGPAISAEDADNRLEASFGILRGAADYLFENDLPNPLSYRINRWIAWSRVAAISADDGGVTMFPPPDPQYSEMFAAIQSGGDSLATVQFAEAQFLNNPLWLDLNRACAVALQAMGADYLAAANAVLFETALFVNRAGDFKRLRFSDGSAMAAPDTLQWLSGVGSGNAGNAGAVAVSGDLQDALDKSAGLMGDGNLVGAAQALQRAIDRVPLERERFMARLKLAEYVMQAQTVQNPWPLIQPLLDSIEHHRLAEWDPPLAVSGLKLVYGALMAAGEAASGAPPLSEIMRRIALIDSAEAIKLAGA